MSTGTTGAGAPSPELEPVADGDTTSAGGLTSEEQRALATLRATVLPMARFYLGLAPPKETPALDKPLDKDERGDLSNAARKLLAELDALITSWQQTGVARLEKPLSPDSKGEWPAPSLQVLTGLLFALSSVTASAQLGAAQPSAASAWEGTEAPSLQQLTDLVSAGLHAQLIEAVSGLLACLTELLCGPDGFDLGRFERPGFSIEVLNCLGAALCDLLRALPSTLSSAEPPRSDAQPSLEPTDPCDFAVEELRR